MSAKSLRLTLIGTTVALITLVGCADTPVARVPASRFEVTPVQKSPSSTATRTGIVHTATKLLGARLIESNGRRVAYDCAGVTRAIYLEHGIDLYNSSTTDRRANGVRLIYNHMRQHGRLHQGPMVQPGDLVFFDNTWDFNGDGRLNDPLTHVGVVERIESDGTVVFISRVAEAVERYRMNLALPHVHKTADGRILNDYIRRKRQTDPEEMGHLAGELFTFYGTRITQ
ncbi:MAG: CHAP domain-containing protein [Nitrospirota bacterium]